MQLKGTTHEELKQFKEVLRDQQVREYKPVEEGQTYRTERLGKTTTVYIAEVKRDNVKAKRDASAKDSFTISRAKLDDYYTLVKDSK